MFKPGDKVLVEGIVRYDLEDVGKGIYYIVDFPDLQVATLKQEFIKLSINKEVNHV